MTGCRHKDISAHLYTSLHRMWRQTEKRRPGEPERLKRAWEYL
ncbi:hypothetical protein DA2_1557 [Desulfovibrio sp. A2]|nr:hypothetical protein DA2_1557 [Desulfovibrio sp. A2]